MKFFARVCPIKCNVYNFLTPEHANSIGKHDDPPRLTQCGLITGPSNQSLFVDVSADSRCIQHKPPLESIGPYFYRPTSLSLQLELSKVMGGYPQIVHFHRIFHHKTNHFGGSPIFRKPRRWTPDSVPTPDCGHVCRGQPRCIGIIPATLRKTHQ